MNKNSNLHIWILLGIAVFFLFTLVAFHSHVISKLDRYSTTISKNIFSSTSSVGLHPRAEINNIVEHNQFLKIYYEIQSNWLNFWLAFLGVILVLMGAIVPMIFSRRWNDEKEAFSLIEKECQSKVIELKKEIEKLSFDKNKIDIEKMFEEKQKEFVDALGKAEDEMWERVSEKKDGIVSDIRSLVYSDVREQIIQDGSFSCIEKDSVDE